MSKLTHPSEQKRTRPGGKVKQKGDQKKQAAYLSTFQSSKKSLSYTITIQYFSQRCQHKSGHHQRQLQSSRYKEFTFTMRFVSIFNRGIPRLLREPMDLCFFTILIGSCFVCLFLKVLPLDKDCKSLAELRWSPTTLSCFLVRR